MLKVILADAADEVAAGVATVRDMASHEQVKVPLNELAAYVAPRLAK